MMSWNYRVFHTCYHVPGATQVMHSYSIRETYYGEDGAITAIAATGAWAGGESLTDLMKDHARLQEAFSRPVLTPHDIPGYVYDSLEVAAPLQGSAETAGGRLKKKGKV